MRICHISQYCHANSIGGTERYILDLIRGLEELGYSNVFGALEGTAHEPRIADGVQVFSLPVPSMRVDAPLPDLADKTERLFNEQRPDIVHFHTFGFSEALVSEIAARKGCARVFTYHSPAWTCRRETLLYRGIEPCDGLVQPARCSACQTEERLGLGAMSAQIATMVSALGGWAFMPLGRTSLRRRTAFFWDTRRFRTELRKFLSGCDRVIPCANWSRQVLILNGARAESLKTIPQGVSMDFVTRAQADPLEAADPNLLTIGYVGRQSPVKGLHLLMEAFLQITYPKARLRIIGWEPENAESPYGRQLQLMAQKDNRIMLVPKTSFAEAIKEYKKLSLLAIPSISLETGPLTLFEALSLGLPVFGSERLGQIDLLQKFGRVVAPNTVGAWRDALADACRQHQSGQWRKNTRNAEAALLRTMRHVASEMAQVYMGLRNGEPKTVLIRA